MGEALYVRAYYGHRARWYRAAVRHGTGRVQAAGLVREVGFEAVAPDEPVQAEIGAGYREKYRGSPYLEAMVSAWAWAAMVRVFPRDSGAG